MNKGEEELRDVINAKLDSGTLPERHPTAVWGGFRSRQRCSVCDDPIAQQSAEIEAEGADGRQRFYHVRCYALLDLERRQRA